MNEDFPSEQRDNALNHNEPMTKAVEVARSAIDAQSNTLEPANNEYNSAENTKDAKAEMPSTADTLERMNIDNRNTLNYSNKYPDTDDIGTGPSPVTPQSNEHALPPEMDPAHSPDTLYTKLPQIPQNPNQA